VNFSNPHDHEFNRIGDELRLIVFHRRELADGETRPTASTRRMGKRAHRTRLYRLPG
jgi:hypothetical protein